MKIVEIRYRAPGVPWTQKFRHVVGIAHTNYLVYSKALQGGSMKAAILFLMNQWMCRAYCHKVRRGPAQPESDTGVVVVAWPSWL